MNSLKPMKKLKAKNNKIAIITDIHFGKRNDSPIILNAQKRFFREIFFPFLEKEEISCVVNLGDTFDRQKYTNNETLSIANKEFFQPIRQKGLDYIGIVGNHDKPFKNTNAINTLSIIPDLEHFIEPEIVEISGEEILFVPWISEDDKEKFLNEIAKSTAKYCFGHFEITGFSMNDTSICEEGESKDIFAKFEKTLSGHFHTRSKYSEESGSIYYLGCPTQLTWDDCDTIKGFHIMDVVTGKIDFIPNPISIYEKIEFDGNDPSLNEKTDKIVKLVIKKDADIKELQKFMENSSSENIQILEENVVDFTDIDESKIDILTTESVIKTYIETLENLDKKPELTKYLLTLYKDAMDQNDKIS